MPDEYMDPSGSTAQFRAFVSEPEPKSGAGAPAQTGLIIAGAVLAVVAIALAVWALI